MQIDTSKLLGFSNKSDQKNDTMVGSKGGSNKPRRKKKNRR